MNWHSLLRWSYRMVQLGAPPPPPPIKFVELPGETARRWLLRLQVEGVRLAPDWRMLGWYEADTPWRSPGAGFAVLAGHYPTGVYAWHYWLKSGDPHTRQEAWMMRVSAFQAAKAWLEQLQAASTRPGFGIPAVDVTDEVLCAIVPEAILQRREAPALPNWWPWSYIEDGPEERPA